MIDCVMWEARRGSTSNNIRVTMKFLLLVAALASCLHVALCQSESKETVSVILLGATGNLAEKYLWQGLYNIYESGLSNGATLTIYPAATKPYSVSAPILRRILAENITANHEISKAKFLNTRVAPYSQLRSPENYEMLGKAIESTMRERGELEHGRLVYLSVPPKFYKDIAKNINLYLRPHNPKAWLRVIVEKPFGVDSASANELAKALELNLKIEEVLLVDHYMGKQGLMGIREFRKVNKEYEALLNKDHVESVEVAMLETEDCKGRTGFYNNVGVIRDVKQNHLMMMASMLTMDLDAKLDEARHRLDAMRNMLQGSKDSVVTLGQYASYHDHVNEDRVKWNETPLDARPNVPTYGKIQLFMDSPRFKGVPFIFHAGKALDDRKAYTRVKFKSGETLTFNLQGSTDNISGPGIVASSKLPKPNVPLKWSVSATNEKYLVAPESPNAYEVLLRNALEDNIESFVTLPEVLESWRVWTPLLDALDQGEHKENMVIYEHGGKGLPGFADRNDNGKKEEL